MIRGLPCVLTVVVAIIYATLSIEEELVGELATGREHPVPSRRHVRTPLKNAIEEFVEFPSTTFSPDDLATAPPLIDKDTVNIQKVPALHLVREGAKRPDYCDKGKPGGETCDRIRAAGWFYGILIFIHGKQYISVSKINHSQLSIGNVDRLEIPDDIDAYVDWSGNHGHYFFKGPNYYSDVLGYLRGPLDSATEWNRFFENGIDAAANRNGITHFFKGCRFLTWPSYWKGSSKARKIPGKMPCYIDAAWEKDATGDIMALLVYDQIWYWDEDGEIAGPFKFTDIYKIRDLNLCKLPEECLLYYSY